MIISDFHHNILAAYGLIDSTPNLQVTSLFTSSLFNLPGGPVPDDQDSLKPARWTASGSCSAGLPATGAAASAYCLHTTGGQDQDDGRDNEHCLSGPPDEIASTTCLISSGLDHRVKARPQSPLVLVSTAGSGPSLRIMKLGRPPFIAIAKD